MEAIKDALLRMVRAGKKINKMKDAFLDVGLNDVPLADAYGDICDAIYYIVGEHTNEYKESVTYITMAAPILSDERRTEMLMSEYRNNHPEQVEQPKPNTIERDEMEQMVKQNGGYMYGTETEKLKDALHDCVNELCYKCGKYQEEHLGACKGCKWQPVKYGEMPS